MLQWNNVKNKKKHSSTALEKSQWMLWHSGYENLVEIKDFVQNVLIFIQMWFWKADLHQ